MLGLLTTREKDSGKVGNLLVSRFCSFCVILASMIEKETSVPEERERISQVFGTGLARNLVEIPLDFITESEAITGFVGISIGLLVLLLVKDPIRGRYEPRVQKGQD